MKRIKASGSSLRAQWPAWALPAWTLIGATCLVVSCGRSHESVKQSSTGLQQPGANVLLLVVDTLRADILSSYGGQPQTTPVLSRLAQGGVQFERCRASSPWTLPSLGSILTGLYPRSHGAQLMGLERFLNRTPKGKYGPSAPIPKEGRRAGRLAAGVATMASTFGAAGYGTYLCSTNPFYKYGFNQGYTRRRPGKASAREVVDWGLAELKQHAATQPFFMTLHFIDVHTTSMDVQDMGEDLALFEKEGRPKLEAKLRQWQRYPDAAQEFAPLLGDRFRMYQACMHYIDRQVGRLLDTLDGMDLGETLVLFTSDHGEDFRDHWEVDLASEHHDPRREWQAAVGVGHGHNLHAALTHVPLILAGGGLPKGMRIESTVGLVDILPTLCDLTGVPALGALDGRSLVPAMLGEVYEAQAYLSESIAYGREKTAYFAPDGYLLIQPSSELEPAQLFDLNNDPLERNNLIAEQGERARRMLGELQRYGAGLSLRHGQEQVDDQQALERLQELGYIGDED